MADTRVERITRERRRELRRAIGSEVRRYREDRGVSQRFLAMVAGVDQAYLSRIEAGDREPSLATLAAIGAALSAELSVRLFPTGGPKVFDRTQAAMIEALLGGLDPRWQPHVEVAVHRPARGVIDAVLVDPVRADVVALEAQGQLRRADEQFRWSRLKAESLPSAHGWPWIDDPRSPRVHRLLLLRSTAATRDLARALETTFRAAYPADSHAAWLALTTPDAPWPGDAVVWVDVHGASTRVLHGPPRGVAVGRVTRG